MPVGTTVCPVCGAGSDQLVYADAPGIMFRLDTERRFIIVGAGIAGISAAAAIRKRDHTAIIVLLDGEDELPYYRPMLTKRLSGELSSGELVIHNESWYDERGITRIPGQRAASIDTAAKTITLESGAELLYDACVLAMGASSFIPPIPGAGYANVFTIRSLDDARRLASEARFAQHVTVIGGGALGLEAAWSLRGAGLDVTVIETLPRLLDRKVTQTMSDTLADRIRQSGIGLILGAKVQSIEAADGKARAVTLVGFETIRTDIVILSTGITPNVKAVSSSGITIERGIVVDGSMRTNAPDVYACGDCAIFDGIRYGLWPEAEAMGATAGANAAGDCQTYTRVPLPETLTTLGDFAIRGA
jgi:NAD(P)H-nitrite reductase large subunit